MFNFKRIIQHALLALSLAIGSGAAIAGPTYQVTVDTSSLEGGSGLLDFWFMSGFAGAPAATATVSNFSGLFGGEYARFGEVNGAVPGAVTISNADGENFLTQEITLGGKFAFTVSFDSAEAALDNLTPSLMAIGLFNADFSAMLASVAEFTLVPGIDGMPGQVTVVVGDIARVAEVPEPSDLLLMLTALALMAAVAQRRAR